MSLLEREEPLELNVRVAFLGGSSLAGVPLASSLLEKLLVDVDRLWRLLKS